VIANKLTIGGCLEGVLRGHGYEVTVAETYDTSPDVPLAVARRMCDLVIVTNTSLSPSHIRIVVADIKIRDPHTRIIVLSGYCANDFVADLKQDGIDGFLALPFEEDVLLKEIAKILAKPPPLLEGVYFS
jgi:DNA-binding NarL/FixJ family response regulator